MNQVKRAEETPAEKASPPACADSKRVQQKAVIKYILTLFTVVLAFIVLSYFMTRRSNSKIDVLQSEKFNAVQQAGEFQRDNHRLLAENEALSEQIDDLTAQLDALEASHTEAQTRLKAENRVLEEKYNELLDAINVDIEGEESEGGGAER